MRLRFPKILLLILVAITLTAQEKSPELAGRTEGNQYLSPTDIFSVRVSVLRELGGRISDTGNVVTFTDAFNTHETIACFKMDTSQRWEDETRGRKDYLGWFFSNFIQSDFEQRFPGARIESASFISNLQSGALLVFNLLPGGSMFAARATVFADSPPLVAKRGNLVFVRDGYVFILSIELAEKVLERTAYDKTITEEDTLLRDRLLHLLDRMTFAVQAPADAPSR